MFRRFAAAASMRMSFGGAPAPHLRHRSLTTVKAASAGRLDSCSPPPRAQRPAHRAARPRSAVPVLANAGRLAFPALATRTATSLCTAARATHRWPPRPCVPLGPRPRHARSEHAAAPLADQWVGLRKWAVQINLFAQITTAPLPPGAAAACFAPHLSFLMRCAPLLVPDGSDRGFVVEADSQMGVVGGQRHRPGTGSRV